jgi:hypothetical protein
MCNAMDRSGNSGQATWRIGRVTGKCIDIIVTNCKLYAGADPEILQEWWLMGWPSMQGWI